MVWDKSIKSTVAVNVLMIFPRHSNNKFVITVAVKSITTDYSDGLWATLVPRRHVARNDK
jgi:hypothetical protein